MDQQVRKYAMILWDYMNLHMKPEKADVIVGFGCYNKEIALRCAELYFEGYAPQILFTGGLGRNTKNMWSRPEAEVFAETAMKSGVPGKDILLEDKSSNSAENILFTRKILEKQGVTSILGVHKPFMERRVYAAMGIYWPEVNFTVTSPQVTLEEYISLSEKQGIDEDGVINILVGDYHRIGVYAKKGYQTPQPFSEDAWKAFHVLLSMGYTRDLAK